MFVLIIKQKAIQPERDSARKPSDWIKLKNRHKSAMPKKQSFKMEEIMKIKKIIIRDFDEIIAELKKVLSNMRTNFLGEDFVTE